MAMIFSGRKNPEWEIKDDAEKQQLLALIQQAEPSNKAVQNSVLGYAGFTLLEGNTMFEIFNGVITQTTDDTKKSMIDAGRKLEKKLLQSVPKKFADAVQAATFDSF